MDTLKKEKLYVKLLKYEFEKTYLVYLGHIVGGGQLNISPSKVDVIVNWPNPTSTTKLRRFLGVVNYWRKIIDKFSFIASPLHALMSVKKSFKCKGKENKYFDTLKGNISTTPVLIFPRLQQPFNIKTDASSYAMGAILMQHRKPICYHSENFSQAVANYPTHDKDLYDLVQSVKKSKHYLMGKETIIHTDHQPLQYLQSQTKLQQSHHYRWVGFLQ